MKQAEAIRPNHIHHQQNENSGRDERPEKAAALVDHVHEIHDCQSGAKECNGKKGADSIRQISPLDSTRIYGLAMLIR